ncbi:DUF3558 domain-containing protein [Nocardia sp. NBC_01499]|uniref:DUF3558 family protein n=1 Tax=Nocardia sp. NBC_01499 TaxID=2903597 RepID=UPI003864C1B4
MTAPSARGALLTLAAIAALLSACSTNSAPSAAPATVTNSLAQCQPLTDDQITQAVHADTLTAHRTPPTCLWNAKNADGEFDITFTYSEHESLQQLWQRARQDGLDTEHVTVVRDVLGTKVTATGFYTHNPADPGDCAVSAQANGSITWRIQNHNHTPRADPCAEALELTTLTVDLSP